MSAPLADRFGTAKPIIAMLHFPGLPGRPRHDRAGGRAHLLDVVGRDLEILQAAGVDGLLFCNENDIPYQLHVGPEIPAAMAATIGELHSAIRVPFGVNILWDAKASLALARATGATFIREVLTGVYESDMGIIAPDLGDLAGYRTAIGGDEIALFDNISPEFSSALGSRTIADRAKGAAFLGVDALLISGPAAGVPFSMDDLRAVKEAVPEIAVIANTGVRADSVAEIFRVADGAIVGTSLKVDGNTWNPVDPDRVKRLMDAAMGRATEGAPVATAQGRCEASDLGFSTATSGISSADRSRARPASGSPSGFATTTTRGSRRGRRRRRSRRRHRRGAPRVRASGWRGRTARRPGPPRTSRRRR